MAQRTGHITQETRGARNRQLQIDNLRKEITKKRNEIKKLIYLLQTIIPTEIIEPKENPNSWDKLKKMSKEALGKLQKNGPAFIRPTRHRVRVTAPSGGESMTQQSLKDECDINIIVKRHAQTGNISHLNPKAPLYIDCTKVTDLQGAILLQEEALDNFATLPSAVRKACNNDPVEFMDMIHTVDGTEELAQAGLEFAPETPQGGEDDQAKLPLKHKGTPPEPLEPITEKPAETTQPPVPQGGE